MRSTQDPHVVSMFEVVGGYAVDTVFNHIYHNSTICRRGEGSLTDEYRRQVQAYMTGVKADENCYSDVVQGIHNYFTATTRFTTMNFAGFVDRVVGVCVPDDYFRQCSDQDKDELLSSIVCDLFSNLCAYATTAEMLRRIIDDHTAAAAVTVRMLQDHALKTLLAKRTDIINKFLKKMGQAREHIPMDSMDSIKRTLKRLAREKAEAVLRAEELEKELEELEKELEEAKNRERKALRLVKLMKTGRDLGPGAAGASLAVPKRETIAETTLGRNKPAESPFVPPRESIAEGKRDKGPAGRPAPRAPLAGGVPAGFFKIANEKKAATTTPAAKPEAQFTNLLSDVVDASSASDAGESGADDILKDYY